MTHESLVDLPASIVEGEAEKDVMLSGGGGGAATVTVTAADRGMPALFIARSWYWCVPAGTFLSTSDIGAVVQNGVLNAATSALADDPSRCTDIAIVRESMYENVTVTELPLATALLIVGVVGGIVIVSNPCQADVVHASVRTWNSKTAFDGMATVVVSAPVVLTSVIDVLGGSKQ